MIYIIAIFGLVIIGTIIFIGYAFKSYLNLDHSIPSSFFPFQTINIVERIYKPVDLVYSFRYAMANDHMKYNMYMERSSNIIHDDEHKQHMIRKAAVKLADDMMDQGLIEIEDKEDECRHFEREVRMRVRIYKEDK